MKKIILVGYMGSGKSIIGKLLAEKANISFIDLDEYIAKIEKMSITEIFDKKGEIYFRKLESQLFNQILNGNQNFVLSLGGGTPCYANNHLLLQKDDCSSVYLNVNVKTLCRRLSLEKNNRPLIANLSIQELENFVGQHLLERNYFYRFAKNTIDTAELTPQIVANKLWSEYFAEKN